MYAYPCESSYHVKQSAYHELRKEAGRQRERERERSDRVTETERGQRKQEKRLRGVGSAEVPSQREEEGVLQHLKPMLEEEEHGGERERGS